MKTKLILFLAVLFYFSLAARSQGNLQFNQVVQQSFNQSVASATMTTLSTITVPAGKVLKIENASVAANMAGILTGSKLYIGNHCLWQLNYSSGGLFIDRSFPLWLNAGTYALQVYHIDGVSINLRASFSGIEFNVVP